MKLKNGRTLRDGERVRIYVNLHASRSQNRTVYSVQAKADRWRVVAHVHDIWLESCVFRVREAGRQKVLRTGSKNVHAFIEGNVRLSTPQDLAFLSFLVTYNPFKGPDFMRGWPNQRPVRTARHVRAYSVGSGVDRSRPSIWAYQPG